MYLLNWPPNSSTSRGAADGDRIERMHVGKGGVEQEPQFLGERQGADSLLRRHIALPRGFLRPKARLRRVAAASPVPSATARDRARRRQRSRRHVSRPRHADMLGHRARHLQHAFNCLQSLLAAGDAELVHEIQAIQRVDAAELAAAWRVRESGEHGRGGRRGAGVGGWRLRDGFGTVRFRRLRLSSGSVPAFLAAPLPSARSVSVCFRGWSACSLDSDVCLCLLLLPAGGGGSSLTYPPAHSVSSIWSSCFWPLTMRRSPSAACGRACGSARPPATHPACTPAAARASGPCWRACRGGAARSFSTAPRSSTAPCCRRVGIFRFRSFLALQQAGVFRVLGNLVVLLLASGGFSRRPRGPARTR